MKKHSEEKPDWQEQRNRIIGLGESSHRKSYYPELQQKITELQKTNEELHAAYEHLSSNKEKLRKNFEELRAKEQELRESEEKYRNLIEHSFDGIVIHHDTKIVFLNQTALGLFGIADIRDYLGRSIFTFIHPDYQAVVAGRAEGGQTSVQQPMREQFVRVNGEVFDVEVVAVPISWGGTRAVQVAFRDITAQKAAEMALRESEQFYRTVFETTGSGSFIINEDNSIQRANEGFAKLTGYSVEELEREHSWTEFVVPEDLARLKSYHTGRIRAAGVPNSYEFRSVDRFGTLRYCINHVSMIPGTTKSICSTVDITDRVVTEHALEEKNRELDFAYHDLAQKDEELRQKYEALIRAEGALRSAKTLLEAVYDGSSDLIFVHDVDGRIIDVNSNVLAVFGISLEDLIAADPNELSGEGYTSAMVAEYVQVALRDGKADFEWVSRKKNGEEFPIDMRLRRLETVNEDGTLKPVILAIARDITERKMAEQALALGRKKLGLLNTIIFQDIQSTIFALSAYLQLANTTTDPEKITSFAEKQNQLIQKIVSSLEFAKNYQNMGIHPPRWQNVNRVFLYALSHIDSLRVSRHVDVGTLEVYADMLLEKALFNLLENALIHGERVTSISLTCEEREGCTVLVFQDNGVGITESEKKKIFERGYGKRAGLGLFLVREILSITGMTIHECGEEGEGARFEIQIPKGVGRFSGTAP